MLEAGPPIIFLDYGFDHPSFVSRLKERGIKSFATATTVAEAKAAETAGADAIIAQGMEAGGRRGAFVVGRAEGARRSACSRSCP